MNKKLELKIAKLREILIGYEKVVIAFSGGVDSSYLAYEAHKTLGRNNVAAVTLNFELFTGEDISTAVKIAKENKFCHKVINLNMNKKLLRKNPPDRCYLCKKNNYFFIKKYCNRNNFCEVLDGSNLDDDPNERPGHKALEELGIKTPLREAGFTKNDVRIAAREAGLSNWDRPSSPCLATRFPHNSPINKDKLVKIFEAEQYIKKLGFPVVRLRCHNDTARIEVPKEKIPLLAKAETSDKVCNFVKSLGFEFVTIDLQGYKGKV